MAPLLYFGRLAEAVGCSAEDVRLDPDICTAGDLRRLHPSLGASNVKIVVNHELARDDSAVGDEDEIAFLPPVSGG